MPTTPSSTSRTLNKFEREYLEELRVMLDERTDLTPEERHILEHEIVYIQEGTVQLTGPETAEDRLERYRNHFP